MASEFVRPSICVVLMLLGGHIAILNLYFGLKALVQKESFSALPLLGGPVVALGYVIWPNHVTAVIAVVALITDPASLPALVLLLFYGVSGRRPSKAKSASGASSTSGDEGQSSLD